MAAGALGERFTAYVAALAGTLAHADRKEPFGAYCRGLILPGQRKSIEPIAARVRPEQVSAAHQSLHHLVAKASWSDDALLAAVRAGAASPRADHSLDRGRHRLSQEG